jgi:tetratricopeptide (TPR) repeat protein
MPAHIYMRLGRYHEAAERNIHAADVDRRYLAGRKLSGDYADGYYTHNLHFLWASLTMEGRKTEALNVARRLIGTITEDEARKERWKELYLATPLWSMIRFGQWEELLHEPPPPKSLRLHQGIWRLGRGMALAASGRLPGAEGEHVVLAGLAKRLGRDRTQDEKTERALLKIGERLLAGELAMHRRQYDEALESFADAVRLEEDLPYTEPPFWPIPIRHYLGAALLTAGQPGKAEAVYRADLTKHPRNGWAQFGLMQSLRAQRKGPEADGAEKQWKQSWEHADVTLTASRF